MGFESIDQPGRSSEVECNPKMSILNFWLERGGRRFLSPSTSPANQQKLNVIQKWAFNFYGWRGLVDGFRVHDQPRQLSEVDCNFIFLAGEGWQMGLKSINQPGQSSEVERNPKMSILFFGWRGVADRIWVLWPANHQKLNVIQKWAFYGWRGVADGEVHLADHQKLNVIQKWAFYFCGWRGVADGVQVHWTAWPIIKSWT